MSESSRIKQLGIIPRKSLGQNFLVDADSARRIVDLAQIQPNDLVFEIGPGLGALTKVIAARAAHVIAIELDRSLIPHLTEAVKDKTNVEIIHGDALDANYLLMAEAATVARGTGAFGGVRFVGNLPYYITSAAIRTILESGLSIASAVLTVQMEVAERAAAQPPDMSLLAVSVQFYGQAAVVFKLSPSAFYPQPSVESAVLRIMPHRQPLFADAALFFRWAKAGFSQPRKQLRNTLAAGLNLPKPEIEAVLAQAGIESTRRSETLNVREWVALAEAAAAAASASQ